jgi:hypothetical protein
VKYLDVVSDEEMDLPLTKSVGVTFVQGEKVLTTIMCRGDKVISKTFAPYDPANFKPYVMDWFDKVLK